MTTLFNANPRSQEPYRRLREVMADYAWISHPDTDGTLVAFVCPAMLTGINYVGFHYNWLSDDRSQGGHVVDFSLVRAQVEAAEARRFLVDVATDARLRALDLAPTT